MKSKSNHENFEFEKEIRISKENQIQKEFFLLQDAYNFHKLSNSINKLSLFSYVVVYEPVTFTSHTSITITIGNE